MRFKNYLFGLHLPETSDSKTRQSIIDYIKSIINTIDEIKESDISIKKREIEIVNQNFQITYDIHENFRAGYFLRKEKSFGNLNNVVNKISEKLNQNFKDELSKTNAISIMSYIIDDVEVLKKIINSTALEKISDEQFKLIPKSFEFSSTIEEGLDVPELLICKISQNIQSSKKRQTTITIYYGKDYHEQIPNDVMREGFEKSKQYAENIIKTLVGESNE